MSNRCKVLIIILEYMAKIFRYKVWNYFNDFMKNIKNKMYNILDSSHNNYVRFVNRIQLSSFHCKENMFSFHKGP